MIFVGTMTKQQRLIRDLLVGFLVCCILGTLTLKVVLTYAH
jgi:uncharacterized membrane protein